MTKAERREARWNAFVAKRSRFMRRIGRNTREHRSTKALEGRLVKATTLQIKEELRMETTAASSAEAHSR